MRRLAGFTKAVRAVAFLPDARLVAAGEDKWVRVFDCHSGECGAAVKARQVVYAVAASPDGKAVAYAGRYSALSAGSNAVQFVDLAANRRDGEFVWLTSGDSISIGSLSYSADGHYLAAAGFHQSKVRWGRGVRWWRLADLWDEGSLPQNTASIVQFGPERGVWNVLAVGHAFACGTVSLLQWPDHWRRSDALLRVARPVGIVFLSPESWVAAAGSSLYFSSAANDVQRVKIGSGILAALAASPDGRALLTAGRSGVVECYDAHSRTLRSRHDFGVGPVHGLAFAPDGLTFAVAGEGGVVVCDAE